jgi:methyltransferase (TIGR00027 family)
LHKNPMSMSGRAIVVARSLFAEDELARAVARGTKQYVVLGAGLDTSVYRMPHRGIRAFEVDHPATQEWKRARLAEANIPVPPGLIFAPVDFERQTLSEGLARAGFDPQAPAFFSWLGVTMYLTDEAFESTLAFVATRPAGGGVAFDYMLPRRALPLAERAIVAIVAFGVALAGEPFQEGFEPDALRERLGRLGFHGTKDLGHHEINARWFRGRSDGLHVVTSHARLMAAET